MPTPVDSDYLVESFKLDPSQYPEISKLIAASYLMNSPEEGGTIAFDEDTFSIIFGSPSIPKDEFTRAIYKPTGQLVGFFGALPRKMYWDNKCYNCVIPSWLAVHPDHQRKGLSKQMGMQLYKILRGRYEVAVPFYEAESHGLNTAGSLTRELEMPLKELLCIHKFVIRIFNIKQVAKVVKFRWYEKLAFAIIKSVKKSSNPRIRKFQLGDAEQIYPLMQDFVKRNEMAVLREYDDFAWFLNHPSVNCVVHETEDGVVDGFLVAWKFQMAGFGHSVSFGWLDLIHTYRLNNSEAADLVNYLCVTSKERGWGGLQCPVIPYFDPTPLKKEKFVFFSKKLLVRMRNYANISLPEKVNSCYLDWR